MTPSGPAEALLTSLGIDSPSDIDVEAIAWTRGAEVRYAPLESCEARIIGYGGRAIITVDPRHDRRRKRYSVAHELGHWHFHRGRSSICRSNEIGGSTSSLAHPERVADGYAADLLLPRFLFEPAANKHRRSSFAAVDELAALFDTSRTATAMRMVDFGPEPAMLVCHTATGRRWFRRGRDVPDRWFPREELDPESNAFEAVHAGVEHPKPMLIGADAWFDHRDAGQYEVFEQTVSGGEGAMLTLLTFKSAEMLA